MEKVIYRHPMGRFEVVERDYRALDGSTYTVREAILTPAKDARGFASEFEPVERKVMPTVGKVRAARPQVTPDERREWVLMHRNGAELRDIADAFGCNVDTVRSHLRRAGEIAPVRNYWKREEARRALALWRQGMSFKRIAAELGKTPMSVMKKIERMKNDDID